MSAAKFIQKHISEYLGKSVYIFGDVADIRTENRYRLIKKDFKQIDKLIDFEIIHAKRSVSSFEEKNGTKVLSSIATSYFNRRVDSLIQKAKELSPDAKVLMLTNKTIAEKNGFQNLYKVFDERYTADVNEHIETFLTRFRH